MPIGHPLRALWLSINCCSRIEKAYMAMNDPVLPGGEQIIATGPNTPVPGSSADGVQPAQPDPAVAEPEAATPGEPAFSEQPTVPQTALTTVQQGSTWGKRV